MIPRRWSLLDMLLVPIALLMIWRTPGAHRRTAEHSIPRDRVVQNVRAHGRGRGDWIVVSRAGWMVPTLATLALTACQPEAQPRELTVEVTGEGLARIERVVDGRGHTEPVEVLPYKQTFSADVVIVQAVSAQDTVDCTVSHGGEVIGRDTDPRPDVAACAGTVPGGLS
jgi:hypothetical protein